MEFIEIEAVVDNDQHLFSDGQKEEKITDELDDLIDNSFQPDEGVSFYRQLDNNQFHNQIKNLHDDVFENNYSLHETEDVQPELYDPVSRDLVTFDTFSSFEKSVEKLKKTLKNFGGSENQFFDALIYGIMFYKSNGLITDQNIIIDVLGGDFCNELLQIRTKLNQTGHLLDITTDV